MAPQIHQNWQTRPAKSMKLACAPVRIIKTNAAALQVDRCSAGPRSGNHVVILFAVNFFEGAGVIGAGGWQKVLMPPDYESPLNRQSI